MVQRLFGRVDVHPVNAVSDGRRTALPQWLLRVLPAFAGLGRSVRGNGLEGASQKG